MKMKIHFNNINKVIAIVAILLSLSTIAFSQGGEILNFDGIDDYADMGDVTENLEELTMEVWVNPTSVTGTFEISYKDLVSSFNINNGQVCVAFGDGSAWYGTTYCSNSSIAAGVWSHIAFSYDSDSVRIFIDGVMDFGDRFTGFIGENGNSRYLGAADDPLGSFGGLINHFAGDMDDFRIWEYGRCESEINNDYLCEANVASSAVPTIYYTFNQGLASGDNTGEFAILDGAGTFEDGTFNGFTLNGGSSNFITGAPIAGVCSTLELPNIQVIGNNRIPVNEFTTSADLGTDFGFIDTLGHDSTFTFSVLNRGFSDLTVNNLSFASIDGSDAYFSLAAITGQMSPVFTNSGFNAFVRFAPTQSGVFEAEVLIDSDDCEDSLFIFAIKGQACFDPVIDSIEGGNIICEGDSTTLTINGNLYNSGEWAWYADGFDGTFVAATQDTFLTVQPTVTTTYYLVGENGCYTNSAIDSFTVQVDASPTIDLVTATGKDTICENQQIELFDNLFDSNNAYSWSTGETSIDTLQFTAASSDTIIYVQAINPLGCPAFDSISLTVLSNPTYTLSTDTGSDTICENQQITLQATEPGSLSFGNVLTYGWSNGSTSDTAIVKPNTTTTYYVTGADANGCALEDSITITVLSNPTYTLSTDTGSDTICKNQQITLQATEPGSLSFGNVLTYGWSNGSTSDTAIVNPNTRTTYYVTGADANGCALEDSITITVLSNPTYTLSTDTGSDTICQGQELILQATEPSSSTFGNVLTYGWSNGSVSDTAIVSPTATTTYYVTGVDIDGCGLEDSITITVLPNLVFSINTNTGSNSVCSGEAIILQGSSSTFNYSWSNGSASDTAQVSPISTTKYYVTVSSGGCIATDSISILVNALPTITATSNSPLCAGETLNLNETGGNATGWTWTGNGLTSNIQNPTQVPTANGTYKVIGTDANNCIDSTTIAVVVNALPIITATSNSPLCLGETLNLNETGGNATGWTWTGNGLTSNIQNPTQIPTASGTYKVIGTDANNCIDSTTIAVVVNALPTITATSNSPLCLGETLNLNENGGNATGWTWTGNGLTSSIQNPTQVPTANGTYKVIGTDANNCIDSTTLSVIVNALPTITATSNSPLCLGEILNLNETGGNATGWTWSGNGLTSNIQNPTQVPTANGTYKVIGTDANNCIDSTTLSVIVNALPTITATSNSPLCLGETLNLNETGGNATGWTWTGNGLTSSIQNPTQTPTASGTYKVIGTDANNCIDSTTIAIVVNALPTITATSNSPLCLGETLNLNETGGNATGWTWSGNGLTSNIQNPTQVPTANGTYKIIGTDANNCIDSTTLSVIVNALPTITATSNSPLCLGETLNLNENGGNATGWTWTGNGLTSNIQNPTQVPTASGTYKVIGTDANNCIDSTTISVIVNALPIVTATSNSPLCLGETLNLNETGGNATGWTWSGNGLTSNIQNPTQVPTASGTYKIIGTDANNCIDSTTISVIVNALPTITATSNSPLCLGETLNLNETGGNATGWTWTGNGLTSSIQNPTQIPTASGTYKVIGTDANNCIDSTTIAIVVNALPTITATSNSPLCLGETLNLNETGGNATGWTWSGNGLTSNIQNPTQVPTANGTYKVIGTDANNCIDSTTIAVVVNALPTITATSNSPLCLGETLNLNETGGNATGWTWSGNGLTSSIQNPTQVPTANGTYKVIGTDANNCIDSTTIPIIVNALPIITATSNSPLCLGETLNLNETGGNATGWTWTGNGLTSNIQNPTQVPTANGTYKVIGTDANNCIDSTTIPIIVNALPIITATSNSPLCLGETLNLNENGGNATGWTWSGNGLTSNIQNPTQVPTASGTYKVIGTDANNCIDSTTIPIIVNALPIITATSNSPLCLGETLNLSETGGNSTGWTWTGNGLTSSIQNPTQVPTASGTYKVIGTDANNCIDSTTISVIVNALPIVTATSNSPLCLGETLNLNENGGNATGWTWTGNGLTSNIQNPTQVPTASGTYKVIGTDANNCIDSTTLSVIVNALPIITATVLDTFICENENLNLTETGNEATSWVWSGPNNYNSTFQNPILTAGSAAQGMYQVQGTDVNNCSNIDSIFISTALGQAFTANLLMPDSACVGDTIYFFDISQTALLPTSVVWNFGDGNTSQLRDATHIYQNIGVYNLNVTVFDQECGNISIEKQIHITNCVRRNIIAGESNIYTASISPNPARGQFQIKLELNVPDDIIIELYNLKGELIDRKVRENIAFMVDYFEPQNPGLYLMKIRTLKIPSIISKKIIVID